MLINLFSILSLLPLVLGTGSLVPLEFKSDFQALNPLEIISKRAITCATYNYCNYQTDVNNCGYNYNVCPGSNTVSAVAVCSYGSCTYACALGYDYDFYTRKCIDVYSDVLNCGVCGSACTLTGASYARCELGVCYASACLTGYTFDANGVCQLTTNYLNDVNNCGRKGNVCPNTKLLNSVAACANGICGSECANDYDYDYNISGCRDVSSDTFNCGQCGTVCALPGAATATCEAGTCYAATCLPGFQKTNYVCQRIINTDTDTSNCGSILHVCPTSYANGAGSTCIAGVCQPISCATGFSFNFSTQLCTNVAIDTNNCGKVGNICSFPHSTGSCIGGVCTIGTCNSGYLLVNGVCSAIVLATDSNNCGRLGNVCSFPNGVGSCVAGVCTTSSCNPGFSLANNVCTAINTQTDAKNCGSLNHVCPANYSNGGAGVCIAGVCSTVCNTGFTFDPTINGCRDVLSDVHNCGSLSHICTISSGTASCTAGVCGYSACKAGFVHVGTTCTAVDTTSDLNNCGAIGKICQPIANGSGLQCIASVCTTTCNAGFAFDPSVPSCKQTSTDLNNCGRLGNVCIFPNGSGSCVAGVCKETACATGFQMVAGACAPMDITTDSNNCGAVGKVCSFPNGLGRCVASICTTTSCNAGYVLVNNSCSKVDTTTDLNNCGVVGNKCPASYVNGGAAICSNSVCSTTCNLGYSFDFTGSYCRSTSSDTQNCGAIGNICKIDGAATGAIICSNSVCKATACALGYNLATSGTSCVKIDLTSDLNNCGTLGFKCNFLPAGTSTGICANSVCVVKVCPVGYTVPTSPAPLNACIKNPVASAAAHLKKRKVTQRTLCPSGETACPISGSASFERARMDGFNSFKSSIISEIDISGLSGGGYECIAIAESLDSCGGCASMGEGQNCLEIRGVNGVGCDNGKCIVFSCQTGYRPNLTQEKCIRIHDNSHTTNRSRTHVPRGIGHNSHLHHA